MGVKRRVAREPKISCLAILSFAILRLSSYNGPGRFSGFTSLSTGRAENASVHKAPFLFSRGMGFFIPSWQAYGSD
jgi:hypothetical protein